MKSFSIISLCAFMVLATACEKHPASALPQKHGAGEHQAAPHGGAEHAAKPAAHAGEAKPAGEVKPAETPKYFPEGK